MQCERCEKLREFLPEELAGAEKRVKIKKAEEQRFLESSDKEDPLKQHIHLLPEIELGREIRFWEGYAMALKSVKEKMK